MSVKERSVKERFLAFSPTDYRYAVEDLRAFLSEEAFVKYKARVEAALAKAFASKGILRKELCEEIVRACEEVSAEEVYEEEKRTRHDIRALVNVIRRKVSEEAKPFVHLCATSYDIVDTANALRYKDALEKVIIPDLLRLESVWMRLALREKDTLQIGRTHGQHAVPITFGFAIANYVHRLGTCILRLKDAASNLVGKFSGAVGAYNALSLIFENSDDVEAFEREVLGILGLKPALISTQIVPAEHFLELVHAVIASFSVLANFCDDMRNLQRSEIAEVRESFEEERQVGSSTMPHKRNPVGFEGVKSLWKRFMPQIVTMHLDQISEHQRDLTNSASQRYLQELLVVFDFCVRRLTRISERLEVECENMRRNFEISKDFVTAEPLYILLALHGHPNAHEHVRKLAFEAYREGKTLKEIAIQDKEIAYYMQKFTERQREIVFNAEKYVGIASKKVERVVEYWKRRLNIHL
ncbi:MAG: adenylosuccinate lyase [Candidatus Methanospirare jalkutatii]|nr:MAG: adenylosuccinate lyase [Candidatus Methanospirare jalkutatii]